MRNKLLVTLMVAGILVGTAACSNVQGADNGNKMPPAPDKYIANITAEDFAADANIIREVEVKAGDTFTVVLDSNATTGFHWTEQADIDGGVIEQLTHDYIAPNNGEAPVAGAAGVEEWTFKAGTAGNTIIRLSYDRPWESGEKGIRTFELKVVVN
jgi:predicted secreted protein